ncbi:hypothetical protein DIPPA_05959 [Diplonema papillatum]|nr:hypothetical protein DIPPA_05959 [Diplonema papillatum]
MATLPPSPRRYPRLGSTTPRGGSRSAEFMASLERLWDEITSVRKQPEEMTDDAAVVMRHLKVDVEEHRTRISALEQQRQCDPRLRLQVDSILDSYNTLNTVLKGAIVASTQIVDPAPEAGSKIEPVVSMATLPPSPRRYPRLGSTTPRGGSRSAEFMASLERLWDEITSVRKQPEEMTDDAAVVMRHLKVDVEEHRTRISALEQQRQCDPRLRLQVDSILDSYNTLNTVLKGAIVASTQIVDPAPEAGSKF